MVAAWNVAVNHFCAPTGHHFFQDGALKAIAARLDERSRDPETLIAARSRAIAVLFRPRTDLRRLGDFGGLAAAVEHAPPRNDGHGAEAQQGERGGLWNGSRR